VLRLLASPRAAGVIGCLSLLVIGWSGLLVPSLIRSIEHDFGQTDAGVGIYYLVWAVAYASGSLGGGVVTERLGRRRVLVGACLAHGVGLAILTALPPWGIVLLSAVPGGLGAGAIDGGANGLILDLFQAARGRALNTLHLFFSIGALSSPLVVGQLVEAGIAWQAIILVSAASVIPLAGFFAIARLPHGRRDTSDREGRSGGTPIALTWPLVTLELGICFYVAAEVGVSDWLVRFLDSVPLGTATGALSLFWAGMALGRLVSARIADRFDHLQFTTVAVTVAGLATFAAVVVPSVGASIALFGLVGFASGPVFPMIVAIAGDRFPERSAAVGGFMTAAAVVGAVLYPPVMGFMSVNVGLAAAMIGAGALSLASTVALLAARRLH
jgi:MFS transporter, FHS family, glucose/mannose:H+ symporter